MKTEGTQFCFLFHAAKRRGVVARFEGGRISSDAGGLLLREVEKRTEIVKRLAGCFRDHREAGRTEHRVEELVGQRVYALALGYEDLNDHEELRRDPLLALLAGKEDLTGEERVRARDTGNPLAGKSTLNRLELTRATVAREERYKKIALDTEAVDRALVEVFLEAHREAPPEIVLDLDATDDPVHGQQEGRFFHGRGAVFPRLLPGVLFPAAVHLLRGASAVRAARWRTASRSSNWPCLRIAPRRGRCGAIRSASIFLPSLIC